MVAHVNYFYSGTIRNYMLSVCRIFCNFYVDTQNKADNGKPILRKVPCRYATSDRTVASILTNNTNNFIMAAPFMILTLSDVNMARGRTQTCCKSNYEQPIMRHYDKTTEKYTSERGVGYEVERLNPVPIDLEFELHIFTTNQINKQELIEQIRLIFNPSLDLQLSSNPLDWNWVNVIELQDIKYTDRSYPINSSDFDVASLKFKVEGFLCPPAKVNIAHSIQNIITSINENIEDPTAYAFETCSRLESTPTNNYFKIEDNKITLLDSTKNTSKKSWKQFLDAYGFYEENVSQLKLRVLYDDRNKKGLEVVGTIKIETEHIISWNIDKDTLPRETSKPIYGIINPTQQYPSKELPKKEIGQRYIIIENDIGSGTKAWGNFIDENNNPLETIYIGDIIEYTENGWMRKLHSKLNNNIEYVYNISDKKIYEWNIDEGWVNLLDGVWSGDRVKLILSPINPEYSVID